MSESEIAALKTKIENHEKRISELESLLIRTGNEESTPLSAKTGVQIDKTQEIFDVEKDMLTVIKIAGKTDKEKTQNIALLALLGYKYFLNKEDLLSKEIRRNVGVNKVPLNNFGTYLNDLSPSLVSRRGEVRSPNTTYRLTAQGMVKAEELRKALIGV